MFRAWAAVRLCSLKSSSAKVKDELNVLLWGSAGGGPRSCALLAPAQAKKNQVRACNIAKTDQIPLRSSKIFHLITTVSSSHSMIEEGAGDCGVIG